LWGRSLGLTARERGRERSMGEQRLRVPESERLRVPESQTAIRRVPESEIGRWRLRVPGSETGMGERRLRVGRGTWMLLGNGRRSWRVPVTSMGMAMGSRRLEGMTAGSGMGWRRTRAAATPMATRKRSGKSAARGMEGQMGTPMGRGVANSKATEMLSMTGTQRGWERPWVTEIRTPMGRGTTRVEETQGAWLMG